MCPTYFFPGGLAFIYSLLANGNTGAPIYNMDKGAWLTFATQRHLVSGNEKSTGFWMRACKFAPKYLFFNSFRYSENYTTRLAKYEKYKNA